jgi:hypothetical protein
MTLFRAAAAVLSIVTFAQIAVAAPGCVGNTTIGFIPSMTVTFEINGTVPCFQYDRVVASQSVEINGATLDLVLGYSPSVGDAYEIIVNTSADPTRGTFAGLPEGALFVVSGRTFRITYAGGTGNNDVVVSYVAPAITVTPASVTVDESGTSSTFDIALATQPSGAVIIQFESDPAEAALSHEEITLTDTTPQTITVTGVDDSVDDGDRTTTIVIDVVAGTEDPGYAAINPADVSVTTTDNDAAGITVTPTSITVSESATTTTFDIALTSTPTAAVVIDIISADPGEAVVSESQITLTDTSPHTITVTAVNDNIDDGDQTTTIAVTVNAALTGDANYDPIDPADVTVTTTNDDTAAITVTPTSVTVSESGTTTTFAIALTSEPAGAVVIDIVSDDVGEATVSDAQITLTNMTPRTITVTGVNDAIDDGDQLTNITIAVNAALTADSTYDPIDPTDVTVTTVDNDTAGITVTPTSVSVNESGTSTTFQISLNTEPTGNVVMDLASADTGEATVSDAQITLANMTPRTVTVTGVNDAVDDGDQLTNIAITVNAPLTGDPNYDAINPNDVGVTTVDDDGAGVTINPVGGLATTETGVTDRFTIVLASAPTASVTVNLSSSDTTEGTLSTPSVTFDANNWSTLREVTITPVDDAVDDGDIAYTIVTTTTSADPAYEGIAVADVAVTNADDDTAAIVVSPTGGLVTGEDGTDATFTIRLASQPEAEVVIHLSTTSDEVSVVPASLTFTSTTWETPQTVTITGLDDAAADGDQPFTILTRDASSTDPRYSGMIVTDVTGTNTDDETSSSDSDGDGVPDAVEQSGPNGGDGNGDGVPDATQSTVATLPAANDAGFITVIGTCDLRNVAAVPRTSIAEPFPGNLPFGLIAFRLPCATTQMSILYHGGDSWPADTRYVKHGPTTPGNASTTGWYTLPGVSFDTTVVGGDAVARARFPLSDGQLGDDTAVDGWIVDQGGPFVPNVPVPALSFEMMLVLAASLAIASVMMLKRLGSLP